MKRLAWRDLADGTADACDGAIVEIAGWMIAPDEEADGSYLLLSAEPPGCCLPSDPLACIEIFAATCLAVEAAEAALRGRWHVLTDDPAGWRYQLHAAELVVTPLAVERRRLLAAGIVGSLLAPMAHACAAAPDVSARARDVLADTVTVDIHSHAGSVIGVKRVEHDGPFTPLAEPMREGGLAVTCLAIVSDSPTHQVTLGGRIRPFRNPDPGELYAYGTRSFTRLHALVKEQGLAIIRDASAMRQARATMPSVVVSAEGGDFLDGNPDRVDEAYERWGLRHLQLTHYRVNELGDIQTEDPVHGGLTEAGAAVIRRCNARGLVVDVAHGTLALVTRAASVTTKPLILSHTSLEPEPASRSRTISPDHARIIAGTGGVIGVWPPQSRFPDMAALAQGMARLVDVVGVDHVGLGSDMLGLVGKSTLPSYSDLPKLAQALLDAGFQPDEVRRILGGNYRRVFEASMVSVTPAATAPR